MAISLIQQPSSRCGRTLQGGFTLVEVMVALALTTIIMAAVLTTYAITSRSFRAIANYAEIHADGRLAIDQFARDMRGVNRIVSVGSSNLVVTIPTAFNNVGGVLTNKTVTYALNNKILYRGDSATGQNSPMAYNIHSLHFTLFDKVGNPTTLTANAKGIQIDLKLRKYVQSQLQSEDFLSARLDMRNIP